MDGLNSFYDTDAGLDRLVRTESTAMIVDGPIHSFKEYHCKVHYKLTVCVTSTVFPHIRPAGIVFLIVTVHKAKGHST